MSEKKKEAAARTTSAAPELTTDLSSLASAALNVSTNLASLLNKAESGALSEGELSIFRDTLAQAQNVAASLRSL